MNFYYIFNNSKKLFNLVLLIFNFEEKKYFIDFILVIYHIIIKEVITRVNTC